MSARKKEVDFRQYLDFLYDEARRQGLKKSSFMKQCGIPRQRFSEFQGGTRKLTGLYFLKMMEGLALTQENVEKGTGRKFTEEQKRELRIEAFVNAHRDLIELMVDDPGSIVVTFRGFAVWGYGKEIV